LSDIAALNKIAGQKAKNYYGGLAWPTVVVGVTSFLAYWALPYLVMLGSFSLWLAIPAMVALTYAAYTVLHESVHGSISGDNHSMDWLNDWMGYLAGTILTIPLTAHRIEHLTHHANTNHAEKDPDSYAADIVSSPLGTLKSAWRAITIQYQLYCQRYWSKATLAKKTAFVVEIVFTVLLRILPFLVLWRTGNSELISAWWRGLVLFIVAGLLGTITLVYLFAYIVHRPHKSMGRYVNTSTIVVSGPLSTVLTVLWGYQNYHSIHHLFPRVPFYQYRRLFNEIEDTMDQMKAPVYRLTWRGLHRIKAVEASS
jgi:beta-carotene hydroxylase